MKDYLKQITESNVDTRLVRLTVREYLQARVLETLQEYGAFESWAFVGGTALRFLYSMPRFSEDLDFSLSSKNADDNFVDLIKKIKKTFLDEDYFVTIKAKTSGAVKSAFIKFPGLPYEINISPYKSETISIRLEIDTNPPKGAGFDTSIIKKHILLNLQHYDKSSLFAGKLHALLSRKYVKGRDVYDLMWYLSDKTWPAPNIVLLNNALKQTDWEGKNITKDNWRKETAKMLSEYNWNRVIEDVKPFVEKQQELKMLTQNNLLKLLEI